MVFPMLRPSIRPGGTGEARKKKAHTMSTQYTQTVANARRALSAAGWSDIPDAESAASTLASMSASGGGGGDINGEPVSAAEVAALRTIARSVARSVLVVSGHGGRNGGMCSDGEYVCADGACYRVLCDDPDGAEVTSDPMSRRVIADAVDWDDVEEDDVAEDVVACAVGALICDAADGLHVATAYNYDDA